MSIVRPITRPVTRPPTGYVVGGDFDPGLIARRSEAIFDDSDLTSMFVEIDGSGGNPSPGETVGLQLDKSHMGGMTAAAYIASQPELSDPDNQTAFNATSSRNGNGFDITSTGTSAQIFTLTDDLITPGEFYQLTFTWSGNTTGRSIRGWVNGNQSEAQTAEAGSHTILIAAGDDASKRVSVYVAGDTTGETFYLEITSIKHIPGQHRTAAADNERPVLDRRPVDVRNLLTQTEEPDGADWAATSASVSGNTVTATGAAGYVSQIVTVSPNTVHTASVAFNPPDQKVLLQFNGTGSATVRYKVEVTSAGDASVTLTGGASTPDDFGIDTSSIPWRVFVTGNTGAANTTGIIYFYPDIDGTTGSAELVNAQLELGPTATPYQRVTNDNDITETGVRSVYSLDYDGVDDGFHFYLPADTYSIFYGIASNDNSYAPISQSGASYVAMTANDPNPTYTAGLGSLDVYVNSELIVSPTRGSLHAATTGGAFKIVEYRNVTSVAPYLDWEFGKFTTAAGFNVAGNLIGPIIVPTSKLTNSLRRSIETYLKRKAGIL